MHRPSEGPEKGVAQGVTARIGPMAFMHSIMCRGYVACWLTGIVERCPSPAYSEALLVVGPDYL